MLTDIKLSKSQWAKIFQLGGCLGKLFGNVMDNLGKTN